MNNKRRRSTNVNEKPATKTMKLSSSEKSNENIDTSGLMLLANSIDLFLKIYGDVEGPQKKEQLASFLAECHYCRKTISSDKEVYMYGDFRGFCSPECCEAQMRLERNAEA